MSTAYLPDGTKIILSGKSIILTRTECVWYGETETNSLTIDANHINILITALSDLQKQKSYDDW